MSVLPKLIYRFRAFPVKIPASSFVRIKKQILEFIWRSKRITDAISKEKNKVED